MIKKLYKAGCFNYEKFILDNLKRLSLSPSEALVLIKVLELSFETNKISLDDLEGVLTLKRSEIENTLGDLFDRGFYNIYLANNNGYEEENISLDGFFEKVNDILNYTNNDMNDELHSVITYLKTKLNRQLSSTELDIISSLVLDDYYKLEDFKGACDRVLKRRKTISIKALSSELANKEAVKNEEAKETPDFVKDFIKNLR